jgi:ribosomal protein S18 acetylase RimI-like enzyme
LKPYSVFKAKDGREIALRPLGWGDLDALTVFANTIARERRTNLGLGIVSLDRRMTRKDERKFLRRQVGGQRDDTLVSVAAFHGKKMVGHCDIYGRTLSDVRHTGVLGIVIIDGYRGVGLGEAMVRTALRRSSEIGVWLVELTVFASNVPAKALYEKLGFKTVGTIPMKILRRGRFTDELAMYIRLPRRRGRGVAGVASLDS